MRKKGEDVPQHSESSHECDENEVMLQAGLLVRAPVGRAVSEQATLVPFFIM